MLLSCFFYSTWLSYVSPGRVKFIKPESEVVWLQTTAGKPVTSDLEVKVENEDVYCPSLKLYAKSLPGRAVIDYIRDSTVVEEVELRREGETKWLTLEKGLAKKDTSISGKLMFTCETGGTYDIIAYSGGRTGDLASLIEEIAYERVCGPGSYPVKKWISGTYPSSAMTDFESLTGCRKTAALVPDTDAARVRSVMLPDEVLDQGTGITADVTVEVERSTWITEDLYVYIYAYSLFSLDATVHTCCRRSYREGAVRIYPYYGRLWGYRPPFDSSPDGRDIFRLSSYVETARYRVRLYGLEAGKSTDTPAIMAGAQLVYGYNAYPVLSDDAVFLMTPTSRIGQDWATLEIEGVGKFYTKGSSIVAIDWPAIVRRFYYSPSDYYEIPASISRIRITVRAAYTCERDGYFVIVEEEKKGYARGRGLKLEPGNSTDLRVPKPQRIYFVLTEGAYAATAIQCWQSPWVRFYFEVHWSDGSVSKVPFEIYVT